MIVALRVIMIVALIVMIIARIMRKKAERRLEEEKRNIDAIDVEYTDTKEP